MTTCSMASLASSLLASSLQPPIVTTGNPVFAKRADCVDVNAEVGDRPLSTLSHWIHDSWLGQNVHQTCVRFLRWRLAQFPVTDGGHDGSLNDLVREQLPRQSVRLL